jgi:prepilin signal peptidase PulO-like enzyme (type II secretory pathway)
MDMQIWGYIIVAVAGLIFGSFAGAYVWRLRAKQLIEDKKQGEEYDKKEYRRLEVLTKANVASDRSRCLECGHRLHWFDLIPLISWVSTGGRCRYCKKSIGRFEPLMELGTALLFVLAYHFWAISYATSWPLLVAWVVTIVLMMILLAYDAKWFLLPNRVMFVLIGVSLLISGWNIVHSLDPMSAFLSTLGAIVILSGLYLLIWVISKGAWVGFGDVKLGLALGLLLGDWQLAFLALFLANLLGVIAIMPGLLSKKISRGTHIPFGPFLIAGFFIALFFGHQIIGWYISFATMLML